MYCYYVSILKKVASQLVLLGRKGHDVPVPSLLGIEDHAVYLLSGQSTRKSPIPL